MINIQFFLNPSNYLIKSKKGWIIRSTDGEDNRQTIITLTEAGKSEVEDTRLSIVQEVAKMLNGIGAEDAEELLRIERKIMKM